tara:strand:- start:2221 stop:3291 length:1071 start_codon:yes stop_codon:yes gene_type:complete
MKKHLNSFYKNKRILITGNSGFKGSWLTILLKEFGANVMGISIGQVSKPNMFNLLKLDREIIYLKEDIRNYKKIKKKIDKFKPEIIFHLAAKSLVMESYENPSETISTNVIGSANILEYVRNSNYVKSLIYVTSDKVYENSELNRIFKENDKLGGADPYSSSKAAAECLFTAYYNSYFKYKNVGVATVRSGNVIGGGDWSENRIIPDLIKSIKNKKKLIIRNPNHTRPWQHVLEPLTGYLELGMKLYKNKKFSGAWNFGPSSNQNLNVKNLLKYMSHKLEVNLNASIKKSKFKEKKFLKLSSSKAKKQLNWKSKLNLNQTLDFTSDWYRVYLNKKINKLYKITLNQINLYFKLLNK